MVYSSVLVGFLRCMSISSCLSTIFAKGNNFCEFLFAPQDKETPLFKRDLLLKERICSCKHFMVLIFLNRLYFFGSHLTHLLIMSDRMTLSEKIHVCGSCFRKQEQCRSNYIVDVVIIVVGVVFTHCV